MEGLTFVDNAAIEEMFAGLGPVTIRRMFGGKGVYHAGIIVALEVDGEILLKADVISAPTFAAAGATQWRYISRGKSAAMPYWSIPEEAIDDPEALTQWTRMAYEASIRSRK